MLDSLFLETFSIPVVATLMILFSYYSRFDFNIDPELKTIMICLLLIIGLIIFDRLNKLASDTRTILLIVNTIAIVAMLFFKVFRHARYANYVLAILVATLGAVIIETSLIKDKNIMIVLGFILLVYAIFKELGSSFIILNILYILFLVIDSPANEINV